VGWDACVPSTCHLPHPPSQSTTYAPRLPAGHRCEPSSGPGPTMGASSGAAASLPWWPAQAATFSSFWTRCCSRRRGLPLEVQALGMQAALVALVVLQLLLATGSRRA
jgi:hypothetical protein